MSSPARTSLIGTAFNNPIPVGMEAQHVDSKCDWAFVSVNQRMLEIREICERVARLDEPVLILGESGTGKEVVARFIHQASGRPGPLIKVNCAATPPELLESEFFGHERGAFTGAHTGHPGKFALAARGTIMLDELGEMPANLQAKFLHVLQDGQYTRVGGTRTITSDARVIAATNLYMARAVAEGRFRSDLFFRLNVITLELPPLRDRAEDIPVLCNYFLTKYRSKYNRAISELPSEIIAAYQAYHWPGNVRQLENAVKRYLILQSPHAALPEAAHSPRVLSRMPEPSLKSVSAEAAAHAERAIILRTLNEVNWNRRAAAGRLGICYKSLLNKIRRWKLTASITSPDPPPAA